MLQLKDLLTGALKRAHVSTQVTATQIVSVANEFLGVLLGMESKEARVVSFRNGTLTIEMRRSSTSQFLKEHEEVLLDELRLRLPSQKIASVRYHLVHHFRRSEL
ncbi:DUF721 domain-containing protein [Candidatus Uhrbacteria bacterium]|nr:DUF721 domain-containing protein [Candidatus Uhrbacteria bacterium]